MEKFTQKWAIIALLKDVGEGSVFYHTDFPLHVTLAGVFATERSGQELVEELTQLLVKRNSVEIETDGKALFGPSKDIVVMKIKKTVGLMSLYSDVYECLKNVNVTYISPEYQGGGYLPHSTFQKSAFLKPGEKRLLKSVSLIDLFPNNDGYQRKIFKTFDLQ